MGLHGGSPAMVWFGDSVARFQQPMCQPRVCMEMVRGRTTETANLPWLVARGGLPGGLQMGFAGGQGPIVQTLQDRGDGGVE